MHKKMMLSLAMFLDTLKHFSFQVKKDIKLYNGNLFKELITPRNF